MMVTLGSDPRLDPMPSFYSPEEEKRMEASFRKIREASRDLLLGEDGKYREGVSVPDTDPALLPAGCRYETDYGGGSDDGLPGTMVVTTRVKCGAGGAWYMGKLGPVPVWMIVAGVGLAILMSRGGGGK